MNLKKYIGYTVLLAAFFAACEPNEDLFPLPYDDRATGSYLRVVRITSNVWDLDDLTNSGFEAVYESVDRNFGADLDRVEVFATFRVGATGLITNEVRVKTIQASSLGLAPVAEPSGSDYLRSTPIKITAQETLTALSTLTTDPDGTPNPTTCTGIFPSVCPAIAFPGAGALAVGDRIIYRLKIFDKAGRGFTVTNPQTTVSPRLGNPNEANITPNLTGGLFYNSPMLYTVLVQRTTTTANANAYTGTYRMAQVGRWAPDFATNANNRQIMRTYPQAWMRPFVFGNSTTDSTQTVTLERVPGGLPTQRRFTCKYRGQQITMVINLEQSVLGVPGGGLSAGALATVQAAPSAGGLGFPLGTTNTNVGTVFSPLASTGIGCTPERLFFTTTAAANITSAGAPGSFLGDTGMPKGIPRREFPNRGYYRFDRDGLTPGDVFSLAVDDDVDEYGRRNGYCNWYTRIYLTFTKL
jgi:hypothetical protein